MEDIKKLFHNYIHLVFGRSVLYGILQFGVVMLLVRILSPEKYGNYVLFLSTSSVLTLFTVWASCSIVRFGREEYMSDGTVRKVFWANVLMVLPIFVIVCGLIVILRGRMGGYLSMSIVSIVLMCAYIFGSTLSLNIPVVFQAIGKMWLYSYLPLILNIVVFVALLVVYASGFSLSVNLAVAFVVVGHILSSIVGLCLLRRYIFPMVFSLDTVKRCLSYSWSLPFGSVSQQVVENIDQLVIGVNMSKVFVGIYHIAYMAYNYIAILPMLSMGLTLPLVTSLMLADRHGDVGTFIKLHAPQVAFLWSLVMGVVVVFSREVVILFGGDYSLSAFPLMILLTGLSFRIFVIMESPITTSYGKIKQAVAVSVGVGILNLGLDWLLVPRMGIIGAAWGTTIAFTIGVIGHSWIVRHYFGFNDFRNYIWVFPAVVAFVFSYYVDGLPLRVVVLVGVVLASVVVVKKTALFNHESLAFIEAVEMPVLLRRAIKRGYVLLG